MDGRPIPNSSEAMENDDHLEYFCILPIPLWIAPWSAQVGRYFHDSVCRDLWGRDLGGYRRFRRAKEAWLRTFLELPYGIPSHDTFGRVFAALDPSELRAVFSSWIFDLAGTSEGKLIAIDGKTIRRSLDRASGRAAIHLVSAWVHENHAVFGQLAVEGKSNEITAIPKLLEMLDLPEGDGDD